MGIQSLGGFLGLHIDIDRLFKDNMAKKGVRKYGTVLINQGDKLTPEEKIRLKNENNAIYGLSDEYIAYLKLPKACDV